MAGNKLFKDAIEYEHISPGLQKKAGNLTGFYSSAVVSS
jgi:hypothetical protein